MSRHWLTQRLQSWGDRPALIWKNESWSFRQLCDGCDAWLDQLTHHGTKPGDTLAICGDYSPNLCALLLAALLNRNIIVPLTSATAAGWKRLMELALPGRLEEIPEDLGYALMALRDAARTVISALGTTRDKSVQDEDAVRKQALASVETVHDVAERILSEDDDLALRGEVRHVAVLFLDVRGFTTISEKLTPAEVVALLNEYFDVVVDRVGAHGGTVNKFIGDAAMCIWGAPKPAEQAERSAVLCALEIQARAAQLSTERKRRGLTTVGFGIGINAGEAVAGNLGAAKRLEYTVIGDAVNLAQRIESQTKVAGAPVLISETTYAVVKDQIVAEALPPVKVKGKAEPVALYAVRFDQAASCSPSPSGRRWRDP